jgi:hypothetical protein
MLDCDWSSDVCSSDLGISLIGRQPEHSPHLLWVLAAQAALTALTAPVFFGMLEFLVAVFDHFWPHQGGQARK